MNRRPGGWYPGPDTPRGGDAASVVFARTRVRTIVDGIEPVAEHTAPEIEAKVTEIAEDEGYERK